MERGATRMIDIHSHILPGVDDGAQTEADSIEMAREAVEQGIHTIIATPHHRNGKYENSRANIEKQVDILNGLFANEAIPLTVRKVKEMRLIEEIIDIIDSGDFLL